MKKHISAIIAAITVAVVILLSIYTVALVNKLDDAERIKAETLTDAKNNIANTPEEIEALEAKAAELSEKAALYRDYVNRLPSLRGIYDTLNSERNGNLFEIESLKQQIEKIQSELLGESMLNPEEVAFLATASLYTAEENNSLGLSFASDKIVTCFAEYYQSGTWSINNGVLSIVIFDNVIFNQINFTLEDDKIILINDATIAGQSFKAGTTLGAYKINIFLPY